MQAATDHLARRAILKLQQRVAEIEGRVPAPLAACERFGRVLRLVADEFDVHRDLLLGETRQAQVSLARQVAMALAYRALGYSLPRIGRLLQRDHTTVLHGVRRIAAMARDDAEFAARVDRLAATLSRRTKG